jgi:hypothetical protein
MNGINKEITKIFFVMNIPTTFLLMDKDFGEEIRGGCEGG